MVIIFTHGVSLQCTYVWKINTLYMGPGGSLNSQDLFTYNFLARISANSKQSREGNILKFSQAIFPKRSQFSHIHIRVHRINALRFAVFKTSCFLTRFYYSHIFLAYTYTAKLYCNTY